jgi:hypothetical protein
MKSTLVALLLLVASSSWAGIGVVAEHKGTGCQVERNKTKMSGNKGAAIESMDTYVTSSCSSNITFKDDTKVRVTENSRLVIDDFVYDPKNSDAGKLVMKVGMGTVRYASGQIAKNNPQQVNIKTPTATVAVRGTDFTMTVDEAGQSLILLLPSCKDPADIKTYELEEQRCKVGSIDVTTSAGSVTLNQAFQGTYVQSATQTPTPPAIINTVESKIGNNLILVRPVEIQRAITISGKSKRDLELEELEAEAQRQITKRVTQEAPAAEIVSDYTFASGKRGCNPQTGICVAWDKASEPEIKNRGRAVAFRSNEMHYAEVKTEGSVSNTSVIIIHDDTLASEFIGTGEATSNMVTIKQNSGVLKR